MTFATKGLPLTEKRRAFLALQGQLFPRVGDKGRYVHNEVGPGATRLVVAVTVRSMSSTGVSLVVEFDDEAASPALRELRSFRVRRYADGPDGSGVYFPSREVLAGEVRFGDGAPIRPWRQR